MTGRTVAMEWRGRPVEAWLPDPTSAIELDALRPSTVRATEQAIAAVRRSDDRMPPEWEPLARLLLRAEGVASSNIEGLYAPFEQVAVAEIAPSTVDASAAWVADNLAVVLDAVNDAPRPLSEAMVHHWHRRLMTHAPRREAVRAGRYRDAPGWIGGTAPTNAVYVPPPADRLDRLMADLIRFANRSGVDPVTQAAVLHAQFETIHPYADGNGRLGRVLVTWLLARRIPTAGPPPPVSLLIARDPGGYLSGLHQFREGDLDRWVAWFSGIVRRAGDATIDLVDRIEALVTGWRTRTIDLRADATARGALSVLPGQPLTTAGRLADLLGVTERAARNALVVLSDRGIVAPYDAVAAGPGRPRQWYVAGEVVEAVTSWPTG